MTLNLKEEAGREILFKLAKETDVFIENYRPDVKHRLGIDYETINKINKKIVYSNGLRTRGTLFKKGWSRSNSPGVGRIDVVTGMPGDGPVWVGIPIADLTAGINLAYGILVALQRSIWTRQWVKTSLLESQIMMMDLRCPLYLSGEIPQQEGNNHPTNTPTGVFPTSDV